MARWAIAGPGQIATIMADEFAHAAPEAELVAVGARPEDNGQAFADRFGLKLVAYEAGQHLVGLGAAQNDEKLTALLMQANRHPRMGALYTQYLDGWKAAGGDLMCMFSSVSAWGKYGSWGLSEFYDETEADQPKLKAVTEWMRNNPR